MENRLIYDRSINKHDFRNFPPGEQEYENCIFSACNFNGADLSAISFTECRFEDCSFVSSNLVETAFRDVDFLRCKMTGLSFENCNTAGLRFSANECIMDYCSFSGLKLPKAIFVNCNLREADFTAADFRESSFGHCDLDRAIFDGTNLGGADLATATGYTIDPDSCNIKKAIFSLEGLPGLLYKYKIRIS